MNFLQCSDTVSWVRGMHLAQKKNHATYPNRTGGGRHTGGNWLTQVHMETTDENENRGSTFHSAETAHSRCMYMCFAHRF